MADKQPKVFVGKLPHHSTKDAIQQHFQTFGTVTDIYLPTRKDGSGALQGFAFVTFIDAATVFKVLGHRPHVILGQEVIVNEATQKGSSPVSGGGIGMPGHAHRGIEPKARIFIGNLPDDCDAEAVRGYFIQFGPIEDVYIPRNPRAGARKYAFLTFADKAAKYKVLSLTDHQIGGVDIKVGEATQKQAPAPPGMLAPGMGMMGAPVYGAAPAYGGFQQYAAPPAVYGQYAGYAPPGPAPVAAHAAGAGYYQHEAGPPSMAPVAAPGAPGYPYGAQVPASAPAPAYAPAAGYAAVGRDRQHAGGHRVVPY